MKESLRLFLFFTRDLWQLALCSLLACSAFGLAFEQGLRLLRWDDRLLAVVLIYPVLCVLLLIYYVGRYVYELFLFRRDPAAPQRSCCCNSMLRGVLVVAIFLAIAWTISYIVCWAFVMAEVELRGWEVILPISRQMSAEISAMGRQLSMAFISLLATAGFFIAAGFFNFVLLVRLLVNKILLLSQPTVSLFRIVLLDLNKVPPTTAQSNKHVISFLLDAVEFVSSAFWMLIPLFVGIFFALEGDCTTSPEALNFQNIAGTTLSPLLYCYIHVEPRLRIIAVVFTAVVAYTLVLYIWRFTRERNILLARAAGDSSKHQITKWVDIQLLIVISLFLLGVFAGLVISLVMLGKPLYDNFNVHSLPMALPGLVTFSGNMLFAFHVIKKAVAIYTSVGSKDATISLFLEHRFGLVVSLAEGGEDHEDPFSYKNADDLLY